MFSLPTQVNSLYFILSLIVAIAAILFAIILNKSQSLDKLKKEFSRKELHLNQKLYETAVLKNKLEAMVERMTEGVFMLDKDFKLIVANPACRRMLGVPKNKPITIFDLVRGFDEHFPIEETIAEVFETGEEHRISEVSVNDKFLQITVLPIEVAEGVPGVGVLLHDQTEEQNLRHEQEEFMAMMVHELRSPLTVVKGTADMLIKSKDRLDDKKKDELLKQIGTTSDQLLNIINTLLTDTKEDSGKYVVKKQTEDINVLLDIEIENYKSLAEERNIKLVADLDRDIPKLDFDKTKLIQVLNNLLSNAIKFTHEGSITIRSLRADDKHIRVEVVDTGEGIPRDKKSKLFQKFVQLHEAEDPSLPGTGLGLVIAKGIIDAHGGKIWVEDNRPRGTKLIFTLPLND